MHPAVQRVCNVPRQKVNFSGCKLPPPSPPELDNRLSSGPVIASFQMEMLIASLLSGCSKQCTNYSLQGMEE